MNILVFGGAGYIGSHIVKQLINSNHKVIVLDNLQTGHAEAVPKPATFIKGNVKDITLLRNLFTETSFDIVFHFAANSSVEESMKDPLLYFDNNVSGLITLLEVMNEFAVKTIIFSSTAAVYGDTSEEVITEDTETLPKNHYGESKRMMETIIQWCHTAYDINYVVVRYFNVAGADLSGTIGEDHQPETHLIPIVLEVPLGKREYITIFGDDYNTKDGTTVRDYVHVVDLANAHLLAMDYLLEGKESTIFNVGSSTGFSTLEIINKVEDYTQKKIPIKYDNRREGDPHSLIASSKKIESILGWKPQYTDLESIIDRAWRWHTDHPTGYEND
ncbi:UDP-glucose 4-epimerase [Enterococcus haemoperoxidus ATCC BAA-382]|uniref:UDP-glucose 4-epimerase n=1 Tax=Enterococcus haemoperoxidus ATCC BAA-382 TaxID=1158608 RepID=R2Q8V2_9ENTE|nr:UDP-glucose 4-epimerase GalE [Enterococcus haemoperoxidus]EOH92887.1 UDP-glucose 4-epimerase [Enterococcus haemoperoxidus ATCC BAA-382]EOT61630.1 UDP-glucose 4-epimerase [Enterococcus haemoperoxidus ATCC BAA-382]OJG55463.1 UDP-glucose 4-epimerase [Enterococcus haemoperoxidus]